MQDNPAGQPACTRALSSRGALPGQAAAPDLVNATAVRAFVARLSTQEAAAAPLTTTLLADRLSRDPRFLDGTSGLFEELAEKYGADFTGVAYFQACLKLGQERREGQA